MVVLEENSAEEQNALDNERHAFRRMQNVYFDVIGESTPRGGGHLATDLLDEYEHAHSEWMIARGEHERIGYEILVGVRH